MYLFFNVLFPRLSGLSCGWLQRTFQEKGKNPRLFGVFMGFPYTRSEWDQLFRGDETGSILSL